MYDRQTREAGLKVNQFVWLFEPSQRMGISSYNCIGRGHTHCQPVAWCNVSHSGYTLVKASRSTLRSLEAIPRGRVRKMDAAQNPRPHGWRAWKWRGRSGWPRGEWGWRRGRLQTLEHANEMEPQADLETAPLPPPSPDHNTRLDLLFKPIFLFSVKQAWWDGDTNRVQS